MTATIVSQNEKDLAKYAFSIQQLAAGRSNANGSVTLTANVTSTIVVALNCGASSGVWLSPRTANAAAAVGTTFVSSVASGTFTITHASAATTDRTFDWVAFG